MLPRRHRAGLPVDHPDRRLAARNGITARPGSRCPRVRPSCMRPVTVLPRRIAAGGFVEADPHPERARSPRSARGATSRTRPIAVTRGSVVSATVISGFGRRASLRRAGMSNTASRPPRARPGRSCGRPPPPRRARRRVAVTTPATDDRGGCSSSRLLRERRPAIGRLELRCSGGPVGFRLVELGPRHGVLGDQVAHAVEVVVGLHDPRLCRGELRARRLQAGLLVLRIEAGDELAGAHRVPDADVAARSAARRCGTTG